MAEQLPSWTFQKIFILVIVAVFVLSSFALTGMVLWEQFRSDSTANQVEDLNVEGEALQGTKLEGFEPVSKVDSLQKIDQSEGEGAAVKPGETVTVHYTGAVAATGVIFQSSLDSGQPVTFPLSGVIEGWQEGIPGMKAGGKRRLIIPADQAYGENPPAGSNIPVNAPLVFDVQLISIGE
jgi:FKBP-type peptidyl-prolyl cis-trans isomerase FkpA